MKDSLVPLLRSPVDGSPLRLAQAVRDDAGEIVSGSLVDEVGTRFDINDGVPWFAPEQAADETFSFKWRRIGDSYGHEEPSRTTRRAWYLERFGFDGEGALGSFLRPRETVLDAGCGSGADAAMFAESGVTVVAADLSGDAAAATHRRLGRLPNVHVLQADLHKLPFAPRSFGYVSSDQVLHHTPDTGRAFAAVAELVASDGWLAVYVYNQKAPLRELVDDFVRERTTRMSVEECWEFSRQIALLGRALTRTGARVELEEPVELLGLPAGEHDVQRFLYWNVLKCFWNDDYDVELNSAINFDWYHPRWAQRHRPDEVAAWFAAAGIALDRLLEVESGIAVVGRRDETGS